MFVIGHDMIESGAINVNKYYQAYNYKSKIQKAVVGGLQVNIYIWRCPNGC